LNLGLKLSKYLTLGLAKSLEKIITNSDSVHVLILLKELKKDSQILLLFFSPKVRMKDFRLLSKFNILMDFLLIIVLVARELQNYRKISIRLFKEILTQDSC